MSTGTGPSISGSKKGQVAFITGASRGIGKATAIQLAEAGFDVAITARTVNEGEEREHSSTVKASDRTPLRGSLNSTIEECAKHGNRTMVVPADLMELHTVSAAVTKVLERWGRIDVVVNNGRYIGPGHMDKFLETPLDLLKKHMDANLFAPLVIAQTVLPAMIQQGGGTIIDITSAAAYATPHKAAGEGGWGMGYSISKGAIQRVAGMLNTELASKGIRAFNVEPSYIWTERMEQDMAKFGFTQVGTPPIVIGKVVRWLVTDPAADQYRGKTVHGQPLCHELGLVPDWEGPFTPDRIDQDFDIAGYEQKCWLEAAVAEKLARKARESA
jgi:NAD(P)-dependent dehydrogenase (short-subunit alcohol dehydrogenase family)